MKKILLFAAVVIFAGANLCAEKLYLNNGEVVNGKIISETNDAYMVQDGDKWKTINKSDISFTSKETKENSKIKHDVIFKFGTDLTSEFSAQGFKANTTPSYFVAAEYAINIFKETYLGAGIKAGIERDIDGDNGSFSSVPVYLLLKSKYLIKEENALFASVNFGYNITNRKSEFLQNYRGFESAGMEVSKELYYGLNVGYELKNLVFELGFSYATGDVKFDNKNTPYNIKSTYFSNKNITLSVGYKI